jgi:hypothetical protein
MRATRSTVAALLALLAAAAHAEPPGAPYEDRWFYVQTNLQVSENTERLLALIDRAAAAGYNGMVLADYKLNILDRVPEHYGQNVARVRAAADRAGIAIIPTLFPIGYSDGLLAHDTNLAEGLPVVDAPFHARGGRLVPDPLPGVELPPALDGPLDGDRFRFFSHQDDPGRATFVDRDVYRSAPASCRIEGPSESGNRRLICRRDVRPFACYRLSVWVRTRGVRRPGSFRLLAIGAGRQQRSLTFHEGGIAADQDWTRVDVVFNTLDNDAVNLYVGTWGDAGGAIWIDDLAFEGVSLVNVLRRAGCPLRVAGDDGTVYEEGRDFAEVRDPKLGNVPYEGVYSFDHEAPAVPLPAGSRIREGQALRVSWYHPVLVHGSQVMCCPSEPKVYDLLADQARRVKELLDPPAYFMSHDEIRVLNWCQACQDRGQTPGQILAENVARCVGILDATDPGKRILVWSDMFDPRHNAVDDYYLVNGSFAGSWEGLPPRVDIANWNGGHMSESLAFFAGRGHRQVIAGYYDVDDLSGFKGWNEAARGIGGVRGFLYTTWTSHYDLLDAYGQALRNRD